MQADRYKIIGYHSVVVLTLLVVVLIAAFQWRNTEMVRMAGGLDVVPLDGRFDGYSQHEAAALFDVLGSEGRTFYAISELSLDVLFPFVYGAWLVICLSLLWGRPWRLVLAGVVVIASSADLLENGVIAYLAFTYTDGLQPMTDVANLATLVKWRLLVVAAIAIGLGLIQKCVVRRCHS